MGPTLALLGLPALWPQATLAAAAILSLGAGMFPGFSRPALRIVTVSALLAAVLQLRLAAGGVAGHPLIGIDGLGLAWQGLFCLGAIPFALLNEWDDEVPPVLLLGCVLGMGLLAVSKNLLLLFIGLEFMSIPAYILAARPGPRGERASLEAALKYFFAGGLAGALFLLGMGLYYQAAGSLALVRAADVPLQQAAVALMGTAALFKVGAFPLHFWLPDVYEASEPELAGFFSTSMKAAGMLLAIRLVWILPVSAFAKALPWVGAATAIFGALLALRQKRLSRLLAYSSISHAGNVILGIGAWAALGAEPASAAPVFFYLLAYLFMSNGAFVSLKAAGAQEWAGLRGLASRRPGAAAAMGVLVFSLAGMPPTGGFFAKLFVWWEAVKAGLYLPVAGAALASLLGLGYYLGMAREMYLEPSPGTSVLEECPWAESGVAWACAGASALAGLAPWLFHGFFRSWG